MHKSIAERNISTKKTDYKEYAIYLQDVSRTGNYILPLDIVGGLNEKGCFVLSEKFVLNKLKKLVNKYEEFFQVKAEEN